MKVSLIIPTLNFAAQLPGVLALLKRQTAWPFEVVVADSSSDDGTADLARSLGAAVITVPRAAFDHGGTRALAAKAASGDVLVFITQDAAPSDGEAIARLVEVFKDPKVGAAYGRQLPHPDADVFGRALRFFNYPERSYVRSLEDRAKYGIKTPFLSDSFAAYSRKALQEIGWFKDGLILGEDTYAGAKLLLAGYKLAYAANAAVQHSHNYTPLQDFRRYFDIGVFHTREAWILEAFGGAEGEGLRFIASSLKFLKANGALLQIPEFFLRTGLKFAGYRLGRAYPALPPGLRRRLGMNPGWWAKAA